MVEKSEVLTAVFTSIAIISIVSLISPTVNYIEFYKSIERIDFHLNHIALNLSDLQNGKVTIDVEFNATNQSGFMGLKLNIMTCRLHYYEGTNSILLTGQTKSFIPPILLEPHKLTSISIIFEIDFLQSTNPTILDFIGFLQEHPERITWISSGQYVLKAFTYEFPIQFWFTCESILRF